MKRNRQLLTAGIVPLLLLLGVAYSKANSGPGHEFFDKARIDLWHFAWSTFCQHPLFGIGIGNATQALHQYASVHPPVRYLTTYYHLHNQYLHILVGGGLLGAIMSIMFISGIIMSLCDASKHMDARQIIILKAFLVGFVGTAVHSMFDLPWTIWNLPLIFAAFLGLFFGTSYKERNKSDRERPACRALKKTSSTPLTKGGVD